MHTRQNKIPSVLFGTLLLDMVGTGMVFPIIPIIFTDPSSSSFLLHGYSQSAQYLIAGLITALFGLMQFIASPILGELSDYFGRKKLLMFGIGVLAISQFFFGFGIEIAAVWLLLVSRTVAGIAAGNLSIAQASIADITEPKDRAKNFGVIGAALGAGFILGPLLGGWIAAAAGNPAAPFWFAGALGIVNLLFVFFALPETRKVSKAVRHSFHLLKGVHNIMAAFRDRDVRPVYLSSFLYMCGFSFLPAFMGILLVHRFGLDEADVGTFFAFVGVWVVLTQLFILRWLSARYSEKAILRFSWLVLGTSMALYPLVPNVHVAYFVIPFIAIPQGLSLANTQALVSRSVSADKQGAALGINSSLLALSQGIIPLFAGIIASSLGVAFPFVAGGLFVYAAWITLFVLSRR